MIKWSRDIRTMFRVGVDPVFGNLWRTIWETEHGIPVDTSANRNWARLPVANGEKGRRAPSL